MNTKFALSVLLCALVADHEAKLLQKSGARIFIGPDFYEARPEVIDMPSNAGSTTEKCASLPAYPLSDPQGNGAYYGMAGGVIHDRITLCAGYSEACFAYAKESKTWEPFPNMTDVRGWPSTVVTQWGLWVAGGFHWHRYYDTTELYDVANKRWVYGPNLPMGLVLHCAVRLNATHTLIAGGNDGSKLHPDDPFEPTLPTNRTYIYDWVVGEWSRVSDLWTARQSLACGLLPDGRVVAAGGCDTQDSCLDSVEIYDPSTREWTFSAPLPKPIDGAAMIRDGDDLLLIGGHEIGQHFFPTLKSVYKFNAGAPGWEELAEQLDVARMWFMAFPITDQHLSCHE